MKHLLIILFIAITTVSFGQMDQSFVQLSQKQDTTFTVGQKHYQNNEAESDLNCPDNWDEGTILFKVESDSNGYIKSVKVLAAVGDQVNVTRAIADVKQITIKPNTVKQIVYKPQRDVRN